MENEEKQIDDNKLIIGTSIAVIVLVISLWMITYYSLKDKTFNDRGTYGDMFGGINALFSGLAFGGIIITILLQRKELSLQREELIETRREIKRTADAQVNSEKALSNQVDRMEQQQFESAFFNLLNLHAEIVKNIDVKRKTNHVLGRNAEYEMIYGRDCFKLFYNTLSTYYNAGNRWEKEALNEIYLAFYKQFQNDLGHYFRSLYHIIKFVHTSNVEDKRRYTSIARAQLSSHELLLLFYNGVSSLGTKFKPLIIEYDLLKNLGDSDLLNQDHQLLYDNHKL